MQPDRTLVLGHGGLVGSALRRLLPDASTISRELDLRDDRCAMSVFQMLRPTRVYLAAAKVGGILANARMPADFIRDNLRIQTNVIEVCQRFGAKLLFLGSSCIYPRDAAQPITESALMTGPLEPTNEPYAMAKLAGLSMLRAFRAQFNLKSVAVMPCNLYGPGDNFDLDHSHVVPGLIARMHAAKVANVASVLVWGTGMPRRELLHVDDLARACVDLMASYDEPDPINIGTGEDISIRDLADMIARVVGYKGRIAFDASRPDGTPRKVLDIARAKRLGWRPRIGLEDGIKQTYEWYRESIRCK